MMIFNLIAIDDLESLCAFGKFGYLAIVLKDFSL